MRETKSLKHKKCTYDIEKWAGFLCVSKKG